MDKLRNRQEIENTVLKNGSKLTIDFQLKCVWRVWDIWRTNAVEWKCWHSSQALWGPHTAFHFFRKWAGFCCSAPKESI